MRKILAMIYLWTAAVLVAIVSVLLTFFLCMWLLEKFLTMSGH